MIDCECQNRKTAEEDCPGNEEPAKLSEMKAESEPKEKAEEKEPAAEDSKDKDPMGTDPMENPSEEEKVKT